MFSKSNLVTAGVTIAIFAALMRVPQARSVILGA